MNFHRESVGDVEKDIKELITLHFIEIAKYQDIELDPKFDLYRAYESQDCLRIFTTRKENRLIAYSVFVLQKHPHFKTDYAHEELLFIHPQERGFGMSFLEFTERQLEMDGIGIIYRSVTPELDFSVMLERKGYELSTKVYSKRVRLNE